MKKMMVFENIVLSKLVHGGQALGTLEDGQKIFAWGGLPGELVDVRITKKKKSYLEGIVKKVHTPSKDRIEPLEPDTYLSSSPWQIMQIVAENQAKQSILEETFAREKVSIPKWGTFTYAGPEYGYRNKVELGFWGDEQGLHYASYVRGTHGKQIVTRNALAKDTINTAMPDFLTVLSEFAVSKNLRAGDFKTVIFRCDQQGKVVAALFTKVDRDFSDFKKPNTLQGLTIYYSNPKSPASVPTKELYTKGDVTLADQLMGWGISYDVSSFFQVNVPVFRLVLGRIDYFSGGLPKIDLYSGVGSIGIPIGMTDVLVDIDASNIAMARRNIDGRPIEAVCAPSEKVLDYIDSEHSLIVDPPRAGLHHDVVERILDVLPPQIVYLSCNPSTQARDVKVLVDGGYKIRAAEGYNFFPRTPHIESLVVLERSHKG